MDMSQIALELAQKKDNMELLDLMANMPMPGSVRVAYRREPDFFRALRVEGRTSQTIVGRDTDTGKIAGMGTRSVKPVYVNGRQMQIGYLSGLRVLESYRGTIHLARGYQMLRTLHNDGQATLYLSTMLNDNLVARKLTRSRTCLPAYHDIGQFRAVAISLECRVPTARNSVEIRPATHDDTKILVEFMKEQGKRRQFFPAYSSDDFFTDDGLLRGLRPENILLAFHGERLDGVVAAWDQKSFRRSTVTGYSRWIGLARPFYNLWAKLTRLPTLPPFGSTLNYFYMALPCIRNDSEDVFLALLGELIRLNKHQYDFLMAGMHESDPLFPTLCRFRHFDYLSRLYVVCWEDGEELFTSLNGRTPYLELGAL